MYGANSHPDFHPISAVNFLGKSHALSGLRSQHAFAASGRLRPTTAAARSIRRAWTRCSRNFTLLPSNQFADPLPVLAFSPSEFLGRIPVKVRHGLARGAWWSIYPHSAYWRLGGNDACVEEALRQ